MHFECLQLLKLVEGDRARFRAQVLPLLGCGNERSPIIRCVVKGARVRAHLPGLAAHHLGKGGLGGASPADPTDDGRS